MPAEIHTKQTPRGMMSWRLTTLDQADESFDHTFWQAQSAEARFAAAWEMVEAAWEMKGRPRDELRLQRTLGRFVPMPG